MSAGTQLRKVREQLARAETELLKLQIAASGRSVDGRARSLLRRILPYVRHRTDCSSRDRGGVQACTCELDDVRDEIAELLEE